MSPNGIYCGTMTISCSSISFSITGDLYYYSPSSVIPAFFESYGPIPITGNSNLTSYGSAIIINSNNTISYYGLNLFSNNNEINKSLSFTLTAEINETSGVPLSGTFTESLTYYSVSGTPGYNDYVTDYFYPPGGPFSSNTTTSSVNSLPVYAAKKTISDAASADFKKASEVARASAAAKFKDHFTKDVIARQAALDPSKKPAADAAAAAATAAGKKAADDADAEKIAKAKADAAAKATDDALPSIKDLVNTILDQQSEIQTLEAQVAVASNLKRLKGRNNFIN